MIISTLNHRRKQNGYTLIELLLVVTVIALIAALSVKTYRDKAQSDRINIASLNIQHVLESGMSYNVANNGLWPKKNWSPCNSGANIDDTVFVQNYLPNESNQSNFGSPLCWNGDDPSDTTLAQKAKRFWVAMSVGSDQSSVNTAARIAARLPNAIITNDPSNESSPPDNKCTEGQTCYVKAVVSIPSASTTNNKTYVSGAGYCDSNISHGTSQSGSGSGVSCQRTTLATQFPEQASSDTNIDSLSQYEIDFQCKAGEIPDVYVTPNFVRMDRYKGTAGGEKMNTSVDPMFELSGAPEINPYPTSTTPARPPYYMDYHQYCNPTTADGSVQCFVTMVATFGFQNGSPAVTVGCTTHMQSLGLCSCIPVNSGGGGGCASDPGAIGATYTALCNPTSSAKLSASTDKSFW